MGLSQVMNKQFAKVLLENALLWRQVRRPNILPFLGVSLDALKPGICMVSPRMVWFLETIFVGNVN